MDVSGRARVTARRAKAHSQGWRPAVIATFTGIEAAWLQHAPGPERLSEVRFLIPLAVLATSLAASVADARPAIIFPDSGRLPPEPWLYVATPGEPKIAITSGGRRVPF